MSKIADMTGKRFGRLHVRGLCAERKGGQALWDCVCDCGEERKIIGSNLRQGFSQSCGCLTRERTVEALTTHGDAKVGMVSREYTVWQAMLSRCNNPNQAAYPDYGGRGIKVCDRWRHDFAAFLADMGRKPSPSHEIDRFPNNDGNYEPGNCRWATRKEQMRNTRQNVNIEHNGRTMCLSDWATENGLHHTTLRRRLGHGWGMDRALSTPMKKRAA